MIKSVRNSRGRGAPRWPAFAQGKQFVGQSINYSGSGDSIEQAASPASIIGNIFKVDSLTTPNAFLVTALGDGTVDIASGGNTSRQSIAVDIFDIRTEAFYGQGTIWINEKPPVWNTIPSFGTPPNVVLGATVSINLASSIYAVSPQGDTLVFALASGALPPGVTLSSAGLLSGNLSTIGSYSFTVSATDITGIASASPQISLSVVAATSGPTPPPVAPPTPTPVPVVNPATPLPALFLTFVNPTTQEKIQLQVTALLPNGWFQQ